MTYWQDGGCRKHMGVAELKVTQWVQASEGTCFTIELIVVLTVLIPHNNMCSSWFFFHHQFEICVYTTKLMAVFDVSLSIPMVEFLCISGFFTSSQKTCILNFCIRVFYCSALPFLQKSVTGYIPVTGYITKGTCCWDCLPIYKFNSEKDTRLLCLCTFTNIRVFICALIGLIHAFPWNLGHAQSGESQFERWLNYLWSVRKQKL